MSHQLEDSSHGQLFRPYEASLAWHSQQDGSWVPTKKMQSETRMVQSTVQYLANLTELLAHRENHILAKLIPVPTKLCMQGLKFSDLSCELELERVLELESELEREPSTQS